jgi:hypothetical protein
MDANFVTVNPEMADVIPWRSRALMTEKLSRATARMLLISGMIVALIASLILFFNYVAINMLNRNLESVRISTDNATNELMLKSYSAMQSDTIKHMVRIQEILDSLAKVDGTLVKYDVTGGNVEWQALIPPAFAKDFGEAQGLEGDGRVRIKSNK